MARDGAEAGELERAGIEHGEDGDDEADVHALEVGEAVVGDGPNELSHSHKRR
jgi:hypothetical protein